MMYRLLGRKLGWKVAADVSQRRWVLASIELWDRSTAKVARRQTSKFRLRGVYTHVPAAAPAAPAGDSSACHPRESGQRLKRHLPRLSAPPWRRTRDGSMKNHRGFYNIVCGVIQPLRGKDIRLIHIHSGITGFFLPIWAHWGDRNRWDIKGGAIGDGERQECSGSAG